MKNVRVKVRYRSCLNSYCVVICEGKKVLMSYAREPYIWETEKAAIRNAKKMAERIGIPYSDEIIKQHGC